MERLLLQKDLGLTLKQFKTKISLIGMNYKEEYSDDEIAVIKDFCNQKLSRSQQRELPYIQKGWIPLHDVEEEFKESISHNTLNSYLKYLDIEIYKPCHQMAFLSAENKDKLKTFIDEHPDHTERKVFLEKETCIERYGTENPSQSETSRIKLKEKCSQNSEERLSKARKTCKEKYGVENYFQLWDGSAYWNSLSDERKKERNRKLSESKAKYLHRYADRIYLVDLVRMYDKDDTGIARTLEKLGIYNKDSENHVYVKSSDLEKLTEYFKTTEMSGTSVCEKEILAFVQSLVNDCEEIITNTRSVISPCELDIYVPLRQLAIEFNGLYWHCDLLKDKNYHYYKTKSCEEKGISLIHIFEDDWLFKRSIVESILKSRFGKYDRKYFARKCTVREIDRNTANDFFNENHLQGYALNCNVNLGLFNADDELVQSMAITTKGFHDGNVELTRIVTKKNVQVVGGFSKLISYFCKNYNCHEITSYINRSYFNGSGYVSSGFKIVKEILPSYYYIVGGVRQHKSKFRKAMLKKMYECGKIKYYNADESEYENMMMNGIRKIFDSGLYKVQYTCQ